MCKAKLFLVYHLHINKLYVRFVANNDIIMQSTDELMVAITENAVESTTAEFIKEKFLPFFEQAQQWREKAQSLVVTDVSQVREMKMAREARLALKDIRVNADKTRKALKEDSLRYGKAVQGVYNVIEYLIVPIEKHLEEQEKFAEIQEVKRKAELKAQREMELQPFVEFVPFGIDLGEMPESEFQKIFFAAKSAMQAKLDAEAKAEAERIAREKAEAEERERIRKENERLKAEAETREKQLAAERAKAEAERKAAEEKARKERELIEAKARKEREAMQAKLKAEAEARAKAEAELKAENERKAREEAERKAKEQAEIAARLEAERKAKAAPDKVKLTALMQEISNIKMPELQSEQGQKLASDVEGLLLKVVNFMQSNIDKM